MAKELELIIKMQKSNLTEEGKHREKQNKLKRKQAKADNQAAGFK